MPRFWRLYVYYVEIITATAAVDTNLLTSPAKVPSGAWGNDQRLKSPTDGSPSNGVSMEKRPNACLVTLCHPSRSRDDPRTFTMRPRLSLFLTARWKGKPPSDNSMSTRYQPPLACSNAQSTLSRCWSIDGPANGCIKMGIIAAVGGGSPRSHSAYSIAFLQTT
ncbi:hypothetical protein H257_03362 [Aphanomyces astaci]|uniref:Uncharacterized protein n=1 Tax=Aphanomyces astaci TaxID=112090 RepID=W4GW96_APHAT|nr:hypothetical protein H257_03362 [Aphanomyces astaci]ETV84000.1 hypothetical protein H257_03362 [Aphanomyces astaci]|eukprot:XP_009825692.1 hypothetical protein H257_03362 [Aphanomyces astaci]